MTNTPNKRQVFEEFARDFREQVGPPFPLSEYQDRWRRVKEQMEREGLQGLWVSTPADMCYLTGFEVSWFHDLGPVNWVAESGVFLHVDLEEPVTFDDEDEELLYHGLAHPGNLQIVANQFSEGVVAGSRRPTEEAGFADAAEEITAKLEELGGMRGTIGVQRGSYRPSREYGELFESHLRRHGVEIADGTDTVAKVSQFKSDAELAKIREAASIGDEGMKALVDTVAEGVSELELWAAATSRMAAHGGELSSIPGMVNSGPKNASLHGYAGRRKLRQGDLLNTDMSGVVNRYHSNLARCISLGKPDPNTLDAINRVTEVAREVRGRMETGMPFRELLAINERVATAAGINQDAWWIGGYDLGIAFPPDWVGRFSFAADEDPGDIVLTPGMVMNHEWNFYLPGGAGIRELIDTFIVTEDGVEFPQKFGIDLVVVD